MKMAEHNDDMTYKSSFHFMCSCYRLPEDGSFTVGQEYAFVNTIDAVEVVDDLGQAIVFPEKIFESYFCDFADPVYPVTSLGPIDKTIYHLYFVLDQGHHNLDAIKAYSKLFNVNYVQAKGVLNDKRVLIATGSAHDMREMLNELEHFRVHYEISPPYGSAGR